MTRLNTTQARKQLSRIVQRTATTKRRVVLTSRGKDLAAVVPIEDVRFLEDLEDRIDLDDARAALANAKGEGTVTWDTIKRDLGL
jgi:prevent-host-death family protein